MPIRPCTIVTLRYDPCSRIFQNDIDKVKLCVEKGAELNWNFELKNGGVSNPLSFAASTGYIQIMEYLIFSGASIESRDQYGGTPLLHATAARQIESIKFLLKVGANLYAKDKFGVTSISMAENNKTWDILNLLKGTQ